MSDFEFEFRADLLNMKMAVRLFNKTSGER
jgi:hypothetical protein